MIISNQSVFAASDWLDPSFLTAGNAARRRKHKANQRASSARSRVEIRQAEEQSK